LPHSVWLTMERDTLNSFATAFSKRFFGFTSFVQA